MASSIGDLVAHLGFDNSGFVRGVKEAESLTASMSSKLTRLLAPLAGAFAGAFAIRSGIGDVKEGIAAGAKLNAVLEATNHAAGVTTEGIKAFALELRGVTNIDDDVTVRAAAMLAGFTNIKGQQFTDTLTAAADLATVMETDLASAVKLLGKALNDPAAGMAKLAKSGVTLTDQQQALVKSLAASGDMMGAQQIILGALESKFKGAAKAVADPFTQIKMNVEDLSGALMSGLVPILDGLALMASAWLGPMNAALGDNIALMTRVTEGVIAATAAFVAIKVATIAYATYQRLATMSAITFQAVLNPALLLKVAAGITAAAATVKLMDAALAKAAGSAPQVVAGLDGIKAAVDGIGEGADELEKVSSVARKIRDLELQVEGRGDKKLEERLRLIDEGATAKEIRWMEALTQQIDSVAEAQKRVKDAQEAATKAQEDAADKALEHKKRTAELNDEFHVLIGTMTKQEAAARALERQGFTPEQAADQATRQAAIDAVKEKGAKPTDTGRTEIAASFKGSQEAASIMLRGVGGGKTMEQIAQKQLTVQQQTLVAVQSNKPPTLAPLNLGT